MTSRSTPFDIVGQLGALRRYSRTLTRDPADAEDLVHDALVRAFEGRGSFRQGGSLRNWLLSIVHNTFVDQRRSRQAERAREAASTALTAIECPAPQEVTVRLSQVRAAFLALSEDQRAALHLVAIEGLSYQEAARTLGVPLGTLMSRIGRARAALRAMEADEPARSAPLRIVGGRDDRTE